MCLHLDSEDPHWLAECRQGDSRSPLCLMNISLRSTLLNNSCTHGFKTQMLLYVFKCICMLHTWRHASHDQIPPLFPLSAGAGRAEWLDRMCFPWTEKLCLLLWWCLLFGAVRIWGERERTKFIYLNSTFPYLALGTLASSQVTRGSSSPRPSLEQVRRELGHVCVWERDKRGRERGRERERGQRMRIRQYWEISNFWL